MNANTKTNDASLSAAIAADKVLQINFGYDEENCTACHGKGCRACAGIGTAEAHTVYWETRRLLAHYQHAA